MSPQNESYIAEKWYDDMRESIYDRSEDAEETKCETCNGTGVVYYSDCCGAKVDETNCTECGDDCFPLRYECEECRGEGVI